MVEVIGRGLPHDSIVVDGANAYTFWPVRISRLCVSMQGNIDRLQQ